MNKRKAFIFCFVILVSSLLIFTILHFHNQATPNSNNGTVTGKNENKSSKSISPTIKEFNVKVENGNDIVVTFDILNMKLSKENYGKKNVSGEGHVNIYLDGKKIAGLTDNSPFTITDVPKGTHYIIISLVKNNHKQYFIKKQIKVEVK